MNSNRPYNNNRGGGGGGGGVDYEVDIKMLKEAII